MNRQPSRLSTSPETAGPIAGATEMTIEMLPIITPRRAGGTSVITVVISSGIMIAVPLGLHDPRRPGAPGSPGPAPRAGCRR